MIRRRWLTMLTLAVAVGLRPSPSLAQHSPLGTNLTRTDDWSTDVAFLDLFKTSRDWFSGTRSVWQDTRTLDLDNHGWVRSLQPGQWARTLLFWDLSRAPGRYPAGQYIVTYEGEGTLQYGGSTIRTSTQPGRDVLNVDPARGGGVGIFLTAVNPANYIRNIHVRVPSMGPDTEIFNPIFLDRIRRYRVIRFKDWQATDGGWSRSTPNLQQHWSDRPTIDDARWSGQGHGVPVEIVVALANRLDADAWVNMPHQADDDYVRGFAETVRQLLNSNLKVYVEYSNEVWNGGYAQAAYARSHGLALGLSQDPFTAQVRYAALRSRQIFGIFETVFPRARLVRVLGSSHSTPWVTETELSLGDTAAHTDVVATAPYFGVRPPDLPHHVNDTEDQLFDYIETTMLPEVRTLTRQQMAITRRFGVGLVSYEAGQSLVGAGVYQGNPTLNALFDAANRHPRMGTIYSRYLQDWSTDTGGQLLVHFLDCEAYSQYGRWGSLEYLSQPRGEAPKYDALMRWIEQTPGNTSSHIASKMVR